MKLRCPICWQAGIPVCTVVRKYQPQVVAGRMVGRLTPLHPNELRCARCDTVLMTQTKSGWQAATRER